MASKVGYIKGGIQIACDVSTYPAPRPQAAWPVPAFKDAESSLLMLTLEAVANQTTSAILVQSTGPLPGGASATWSLSDQFYQGSAPATLPTPVVIPMTLGVGNTLSYTIATPMAGATHNIWLTKTEAGQTTQYPCSTISTPVDPSATPNGLTVQDQLSTVLQWQQVQTQQFGYPTGTLASPATGSLDSMAANLGISHTAYDAAIAALSTGLIAAGAPSNWATNWPSSAVLSSAGIKTALAGWWAAITVAAAALQNLITNGPANSPNILTNADKIVLMAWVNTEKTMQTSLDAQAQGMTIPVDHSAYDNAISQLSTNLIAAGAPSTWATTWPDGTSLNSVGILANIATWEAAIGVQRNALLTAIAQGQSNAAQAAAIAAAATNALTLANAAQIKVPSIASWAFASEPALPNGSYPAGSCWLTTDGKEVQVTPAGNAWQNVAFYASALVGQLFANQIVVANFDNLIPNPTSEQTVPTGSIEAVLVSTGAPRTGSKCRVYLSTSTGPQVTIITPLIPCSPSDIFYLSSWMQVNQASDSGHGGLYVSFQNAAGGEIAGYWVYGNGLTWSGYIQVAQQLTAPPGSVGFVVALGCNGAPSGYAYYWDDFYLRRCNDASIIVDGTITTLFARFGNWLASTNNNHAFVSQSQAPVGIYMSGQPFTTYFTDPTLTAGAFQVGEQYQIVSAGSTAWASCGTSWVGAVGAVGSIFTATANGSGTGTANHVATDCLMEIGGSVNIAGRKASVFKNAVFNRAYLDINGADPTGTTSTAGVMMGLGLSWQFTPKSLGVMLITITGSVLNSGGYTFSANLDLLHGISAFAAANGSAIPGGILGPNVTVNVPAGSRIPFSLSYISAPVAGGFAGATQMVDIGVTQVTSGGGLIQVKDMHISVIELM